MNLSLIRDTATASYCQGVLQAGALRLQTIELPWVPFDGGRGGHPAESCVSAGTYDLVLHDTVKHPKSFALSNPDLDVFHEPADVPAERRLYARIAILLHVANSPGELLGCIGVGMARGPGYVSQSRLAFDRFNTAVPWVAGHTLTITDAAWAQP
ncbi:MAG TPA: DUF5675 family protein [Steroidobacteraceae bacterium]|nr:DUF5675 family protein [Steroidobacteraceae bacterium]